MISITTICLLLVAHYVADFVCQTDWMARNKSEKFLPRVTHACVYSIVLFMFMIFALPLVSALLFVIFNGIVHYYVDKFSSRVTSRLSKEGKYGSNTIPNFGMFSIIGLDQLIHYLVLFISLVYILGI
jgi:hypothetical protein